jgi:2-methylcitrate dehydratase PrpD
VSAADREPTLGESRRLARFVVQSRWEDLSDRVRHEAKRSLLNFFATALGGCRDRATEVAVEILSPFSGGPTATVIGRSERLDPLSAAFLNAVSGNVFDFDDTHLRTIIHPTAPVAPPLFALAEQRRMTGPELLHAFVLGVEIECRIGNSVSPMHYRRGWHITSTCGVFGAAAAAAKILALDEERTLWALGNASAQSAGLVETLGSMAKSIGVGNAARGGLFAALMAERGFAGPERPVEGPRGFVTVTADQPDMAALVDGLGQGWEILENTYKPYPCGVVLNPVIDAALELQRRPEIAVDQIAVISVYGPPLLRERADRPAVTTGREAQVSAQHSVAAALVFGAAGVLEFSDAGVADPRVLEVRSKVRVVEDPTIPVEGTRIVVAMKNGTEIAHEVEQARGSPKRPLSDAEIEAKFRQLAAYGCPDCEADRLIDAIWSLHRAENAGDVVKLAALKARA